jgi:hypothetical protein
VASSKPSPVRMSRGFWRLPFRTNLWLIFPVQCVFNLRDEQGHTVANTSATIMAYQGEGGKTKLDHRVNQLFCHGPLGIRKVVFCRSWNTAAAVGTQVYAERVWFSARFWSKDSPH